MPTVTKKATVLPKEVRTPSGCIPLTVDAVTKYINGKHGEITRLQKMQTELVAENEELKKKLAEPIPESSELPKTVKALLNQARAGMDHLAEICIHTGMTEEQARAYQCYLDTIIELRP